MKSKKSKKQLLKAKADKLAGDLVRARGECQASGKDSVVCKGNLQWCHIIGRSNHRLRWEMWNALCMCQAHHLYYTHRPEEWLLDFIPNNFKSEWLEIMTHRQEIWDKDLGKVISALENTKPPDADELL